MISGENVEIRYCWSGDDEKLMNLAKELIKGRSRVNGTDVQKLDIKNGTFEHYLEWGL